MRKFIDPVRERIGKSVAKVIPDPNTVSLLGVALAVFSIPTFGTWAGWILTVLAYATDLIDGPIARATGKKSKWGNYFDAMMDKFVDTTILLAHAKQYPFESAIAIAGSMLESYAKPRLAIVMPITNRDWQAIGERADRGTIIVIGYLLWLLGIIPSASWYLLLLAAVTYIGTVLRMKEAKEIIEGKRKP